MTTNLGKLVLKLEADITTLQRRLDEAERAAAQSGKSMGISIKDGILMGIGSEIGSQITQLITAPINIATFQNPYPIRVSAIRQKVKKLVSCLETLDIQRFQRFSQKISIMLQTLVSCYKSCNMILISIFFDMSETLATKRLGAFYPPKPSNSPRLTLIEN